MDLSGDDAGVGEGEGFGEGESSSETEMPMVRIKDEQEEGRVAKIKKKKTQSGSGNENGCAAAAAGEPSPSSSCSSSVVGKYRKKLCLLKDETLIKEFDQYWICEECGHFFEKKDTLSAHFKDHIFKNNCRICIEPGSQQLKRSSMRHHVRKCHPWITKVKEGYIRQKVLDWDDALIAWKTKNFLTVEQLRNSDLDRYEQLKNLTGSGKTLAGNDAKVKDIEKSNDEDDDDDPEWTMISNNGNPKSSRVDSDSDVDVDGDDSQEVAGGGGYNFRARAKATVTKPVESDDDFIDDVVGVGEDDASITGENLSEMIPSPEATTPERVSEDESSNWDWDTVIVKGVPIHKLVLRPEDRDQESEVKSQEESQSDSHSDTETEDMAASALNLNQQEADFQIEERSRSSSISSSSVSGVGEEASTNQVAIHQETANKKKKNKKRKILKVIPHLKRMPRRWHPYSSDSSSSK